MATPNAGGPDKSKSPSKSNIDDHKLKFEAEIRKLCRSEQEDEVEDGELEDDQDETTSGGGRFYFTKTKLCRYIDTVQEAKRKTSTKTPQEYSLLKRYDVINIYDQPKLVKRNKEDKSEGYCYFVHEKELYDNIHDAHIHIGHGGEKRTHKHLKTRVANITLKQVKLYVSLCETCQLKRRRRHKKPPTVKPILSKNFGERGQVDLINMKSISADGYSYILQYQDHLTKFCILRPLKSKSVEEVSQHLMDIFCILGAPKLLQSDNGREFTGEILRNLTKALWPNLLMINGRPRYPQSQGSVERANGDVQQILYSWLKDNNTTNWKLGLPMVQMMKNSAFNHGIGTSPYFAVFGQEPPVGMKNVLPLDIHRHLTNLENVICEEQLVDMDVGYELSMDAITTFEPPSNLIEMSGEDEELAEPLRITSSESENNDMDVGHGFSMEATAEEPSFNSLEMSSGEDEELTELLQKTSSESENDDEDTTAHAVDESVSECHSETRRNIERGSTEVNIHSLCEEKRNNDDKDESKLNNTIYNDILIRQKLTERQRIVSQCRINTHNNQKLSAQKMIDISHKQATADITIDNSVSDNHSCDNGSTSKKTTPGWGLQKKKLLINTTKQKITPVAKINHAVLIPIPRVDRGKLEPKNIIGVITKIDSEHNLYTIETIYGTLNWKLSRNQFSVCDNENLLSPKDLKFTNRHISLRKAAKLQARALCLRDDPIRKTKISCKCKNSSCGDMRCKCRKNNRSCSYNCSHIREICSNLLVSDSSD